VGQTYSRTPKNYDGTQVTTHRIHDLLPDVLSKISQVYNQQSDLILAMWPEIIGPQLASMTKAVSFADGFLVVKVKNSTLHSLLSQNEKPRILSLLRKKFPQTEIKAISFRIG
jgi:hypothetical protein